jgi:hypothetical protein
MGRINDGGPAFPRPASIDTSSGTLPDGDRVIDQQDGMTLRDYFAAQIAAGVVMRVGFAWIEDGTNTTDEPRMRAALVRARKCYLMADAMVAARSERPIAAEATGLEGQR